MPRSDPSIEAWRTEVVAFLEARARRRTGLDDWSASPVHDDPAAEAEYFRRCRLWQQTVFDGGFAGITWPATYGGHDGTAWQQAVYREEEARYDVSSGFIASTIALTGAALLTHGTDAQKQRYSAATAAADEIWCQLFSEPDAGSDLANLGTTAVADGDEYVVEGQKVWTSGAHHADFGLLLAAHRSGRTEASRHDVLPGRHAQRPESTSVHCARSPAPPTSTKCSSSASASHATRSSATSIEAGRLPARSWRRSRR